MPAHLGPPELILILLIVMLLFGVGRLARLGGELGKGLRSFRDALAGDDGPDAVGPLATSETEDLR